MLDTSNVTSKVIIFELKVKILSGDLKAIPLSRKTTANETFVHFLGYLVIRYKISYIVNTCNADFLT